MDFPPVLLQIIYEYSPETQYKFQDCEGTTVIMNEEKFKVISQEILNSTYEKYYPENNELLIRLFLRHPQYVEENDYTRAFFEDVTDEYHFHDLDLFISSPISKLYSRDNIVYIIYGADDFSYIMSKLRSLGFIIPDNFLRSPEERSYEKTIEYGDKLVDMLYRHVKFCKI